jgi:hypothetical protein
MPQGKELSKKSDILSCGRSSVCPGRPVSLFSGSIIAPLSFIIPLFLVLLFDIQYICPSKILMSAH